MTTAIYDPEGHLVVAASTAEAAWRLASYAEGRSRFSLERLGYTAMSVELIEHIEAGQ